MPIRLNDIESSFRLVADQGIKGLDQIAQKTEQATKKLDGLEDRAKRTGESLSKIGTRLTGFGALLGTAFGFAVAGAEAENESLRQLEGTVNSTGKSFEQNRNRIDSFVNTLATVTKFSDDQIIPALNRAVVATNDLDKGMRAAELATKLAAAGFGTLESNAVVVAKVLDGQVRAVSRLLPEFADLEERLEGGATEADLAAEALTRLQNIADNIKPPSGLQQIGGQIGEIKDAIGNAIIEGFAPLVPIVQRALDLLLRFAESGPGKVVIVLTALAGILATVGGAFLIFAGQVVIAQGALAGAGGFSAAAGLAGSALTKLGALLTPGGIVLAGLIALATFVGKASAELNKLSKASDDARDKAFQAPRLAQFTAELNSLKSTLDQLEDGTISTKDATEEFNRAGVAGIEGAKQRVEALGRIIARLKDEQSEIDASKKKEEARAKANTEKLRVDAVIAEIEREKSKRIELEILKENLEAKDRERGKELAQQVPLPDLGDVEQVRTPSRLGGVRERDPIEDELAGIEALATLSRDVEPPSLGDLTDPQSAETIRFTGDAILGNVAAVNELAAAQEELDRKLAETTEAQRFAAEQAVVFEEALVNLGASATGSIADGLAGGFIDLASGIDNAGERAEQFFKNLIKQIGFAIARALILQTIISSIGGPFGRVLGGLFQDPFADMLARFEGSRFADLFFQGVTRELTNSRDKLDLALADNRDVVAQRGNPVNIVVTEATPETAVEFTDRLIEPRVRARSRQRSTRGEKTPAEIDRAIDLGFGT